MSFNIRLATENDFEAIHALNMEFAQFIKTPDKYKITLEQMKAEQKYFKCLVVEKGIGEIIGFATTFIAWFSWIGKSLYLDDLYIVEKYRGNGIGTQLLDAVFKIAKEENCKKVKWQVSKWNKNAIEFYKKKGAGIDDVEINCDLIL